ncbi:type II secretion system F family protein [Limisalsivibrio acetivorans]|uniref:type II secretion system F family protein n=1 Tax=Limisalsivibrio acetivorans TaxID=1304888 RepID=UPI0003B4E057|nr:type II secretion system F family protein [Limisalsivibrio acetivorans]
MRILRYQGIKDGGEKVSGTYAGDEASLVKEMRSQGIIVTEIKEEKSRSKGRLNKKSFHEGVERLYYLLSAGMKIDEALRIVVKNTENAAASAFWQNVLTYLKQGQVFSTALKNAAEENELRIEEFYLNIIGVGEEVGDISDALKTVMEHADFKSKMMAEIRSALAYPSFLLGMSLVAVFFISAFILPKFASIFNESEMARIPAISKLLIDFGKAVNANMKEFVIGFLAIIGLSGWLISTEGFRRQLRDLVDKTPYLRDLSRKMELSGAFSSLGAMLGGGVEITKAFSMTAKGMRNPELESVMKNTADEIKKGKRVSEVWSTSDAIPGEAVSLVVVGERSARLPEIFRNLGERYLLDFKTAVSRMLTLLEPAVIVLLGLFIAVIVVAIMLAVVSISDISV